MQRNVIVSLVLLGMGAVAVLGVLTSPYFTGEGTVSGTCEGYLVQPTALWVSLHECALDMDQLVLESEAGDFETLENRRQGLSQKPFASPPRWVAAWAPMRAEFGRVGVVKAVYRIDSVDLLKWVNAFDRADERDKERLWADPVPLRRMSHPSLLVGHAQKAGLGTVQRALGTTASANLLAVVPGTPPQQSLLGPLVSVGLLLVLGVVLLRVARGGKSQHDPLAEQELRQLGVTDMKVELGALDQLREEERASRRGQDP